MNRIKAFVFSNFDTLMYSVLNHLSIKAIKHRFSAVHLNCAVFAADDRWSSSCGNAEHMTGCPSPTWLRPLGSELSCFAETVVGTQGHAPLICFPFSVLDTIIGNVWPWNTLYFLFLRRLGRKLLGGLKRLYAKDDFCNLIWITIVSLCEHGSFPTPLPGMI